ncbi:MAG: 2Fe-2S iron-sulfur cluster-binding protein [Desulfofustis sp.]|jgi:isoquinoline 1-oxidoreductase subunit alpha
MVSLNINEKDYQIEAEPGELLVWVINEKAGLKKTRFGCGTQTCGSCKVLIDGEISFTCDKKIRDVVGKKITTREVLPDDHPLLTGALETR